MKLPYKIEFRNCCELFKECFGIEDPKREKNEIVQLTEIVIHKEPKREKDKREKREEHIRQSPYIKKIYRERLDIPVNKYLMIDASTNTDDINIKNEVLSSLPSENSDYVFLE